MYIANCTKFTADSPLLIRSIPGIHFLLKYHNSNNRVDSKCYRKITNILTSSTKPSLHLGHAFGIYIKVRLEAMAIPEIEIDDLQREDREEPDARNVKS